MRGRAGKRPLGQYKLPTGSSVGRAMKCAGSVVFPHIRHAPGPAARKGTVIHKYIEDARAIGREEALAGIGDEVTRNLCNAIDLSLFPSYLESEVTYEFDSSTGEGRRIQISKPRDYPYHQHCFYGTADLVGLSDDSETVIVIDVKTGKRLNDHAKDNWQLKLLACAAAAAHGAKAARVALAYIGTNGEVEFEWADFNSLDLSDFGEELAWLDKTLLKASEQVASGYDIDLTTGDHCEWCPAISSCPAHADSLRNLDTELAEAIGTFDALKPHELSKIYDKIVLYDNLIKEARSSLRKMAASGPLDLGDGKELRLVPVPMTVEKKEKHAEFVKWLADGNMTDHLRPLIETMDENTIKKVRQAGFILDIKAPQLRKVRK